MRFARTEGEATVAELVDRLYRIEGRAPKRTARNAAKALVDLNPQLRELREVPEGAVAAVPDVEGAEPATPGLPLESVGSPAVAQFVRDALELHRAELSEAIERERSDAARTLEFTKSREAKAMAKESPDSAERLARVADAAKARLEATETLADYQGKALAALEAEVEGFVERMSG